MSLMRVCVAAFLSLALSVPAFAQVEPQAKSPDERYTEELGASVVIEHNPATDRYIFEICQASKCEPMAKREGYTVEQINSLHGRWHQAGAVILGLDEAILTVGGALYGVVYGAVGLAYGAMAGGAAPFVATGVTTYYVDALNPKLQFRIGGYKAHMKTSLNRMIAEGQVAVYIYKSTELASVIEAAGIIEQILNELP